MKAPKIRGYILLAALTPMLSSAFWSTHSRAQGSSENSQETARETKLACANSYEQTQRARKQGALIEAQKSAIACAQTACPPVLSTDCVSWSQELDASIPSHVFELLSSEGMPILGAELSIDAGHFVPNVGVSRPLNPGKHKVIFRDSQGNTVETTFVSHAGRQNVLIQARLPVSRDVSSDKPLTFPATVPAGSWLLGGIGVLGLGAFGIFGVLGLKEQNSIECSPSPLCDREKGDSAKSLYLAADISLALGTVALAGGISWWLVAPRKSEDTDSNASLRVTAGTKGMSFSGQF